MKPNATVSKIVKKKTLRNNKELRDIFFEKASPNPKTGMIHFRCPEYDPNETEFEFAKIYNELPENDSMGIRARKSDFTADLNNFFYFAMKMKISHIGILEIMIVQTLNRGSTSALVAYIQENPKLFDQLGPDYIEEFVLLCLKQFNSSGTWKWLPISKSVQLARGVSNALLRKEYYGEALAIAILSEFNWVICEIVAKLNVKKSDVNVIAALKNLTDLDADDPSIADEIGRRRSIISGCIDVAVSIGFS